VLTSDDRELGCSIEAIKCTVHDLYCDETKHCSERSMRSPNVLYCVVRIENVCVNCLLVVIHISFQDSANKRLRGVRYCY
jgi:hypothetical protein